MQTVSDHFLYNQIKIEITYYQYHKYIFADESILISYHIILYNL